MKNQVQTLRHEGPAEVQATKAIQRIQKWVEENYPVLASAAKSRLIMECLIEVWEEERFLAAQ